MTKKHADRDKVSHVVELATFAGVILDAWTVSPSLIFVI